MWRLPYNIPAPERAGRRRLIYEACCNDGLDQLLALAAAGQP
jgi:hypothetical protein